MDLAMEWGTVRGVTERRQRRFALWPARRAKEEAIVTDDCRKQIIEWYTEFRYSGVNICEALEAVEVRRLSAVR